MEVFGLGNVLFVWIEFEGIIEVYFGVGEYGVCVECIVECVVKLVCWYLCLNVVVGLYLVD